MVGYSRRDLMRDVANLSDDEIEKFGQTATTEQTAKKRPDGENQLASQQQSKHNTTGS